MAGHSKWANIKRRKGAQDAARGKLFTKLIKEIMVAAKLGGSDLNANPRLRQAVDKAKSNSMPRDTIERAIAKGAGELGGDDYEELLYEGYGPGGIAILVKALTDNRNRTAADVRHAFAKGGGNLGTSGSVSYMFQSKGQIRVPRSEADEDSVLLAVMDAGGEDVESDGDEWVVTCAPTDYDACKTAIEGLVDDGEVVNAELTRLPDNTIDVDLDTAQKLMSLLERLEDVDDVQETWTNADISDEVAEAMEG